MLKVLLTVLGLVVSAQAAATFHEPDRAACYLAQFTTLNQAWGKIEIEDGIYEPLRKRASVRPPSCDK